MKWHRIWAIVVRHLRQLPSDFNKLTSIIYWPFLDIVIFGFVGVWIDAFSESNIIQCILLTNVALWQIVVRADFGVSLNLLEDIWAQNITNLFSTPLTISEWISATFIEGIIMLCAITAFCTGIILLCYNYNIFHVGVWLVPIIVLSFLSGITVGFLTSSLLIYWGVRIQTLAWMVVWIFAPLSGTYHPISVMPLWMQSIAHALPFHYATESTRVLLQYPDQSPASLLSRGYMLVVLYLCIAVILFKVMFEKSRNKGLHRLKD